MDQEVAVTLDARALGVKQASGVSACRARLLVHADVVECQIGSACHWQIPFGPGQLCVHALSKQIAKGAVQSGWDSPSPRRWLKRL